MTTTGAVGGPVSVPGVPEHPGTRPPPTQGLETPPGGSHRHPVAAPDTDPGTLIARLHTIYHDAMTGSPTYDRHGNHLGDIPNLPAALKATELLMRHTGMLDQTTTHQHTIALQITINGINPNRLT